MKERKKETPSETPAKDKRERHCTKEQNVEKQAENQTQTNAQTKKKNLTQIKKETKVPDKRWNNKTLGTKQRKRERSDGKIKM